MKIVVAPDSFKGSLSATQAAKAIKEGIDKALDNAEIIICPVGDGGEGTVDALLTATDGLEKSSNVMGPFGKAVSAKWGLINEGKTAIIEMAAAAGLQLIKEPKRNPFRTTTYGVGELINAALSEQTVDKIIIGIGGSATSDGGAGMAQALGVIFNGNNGPLPLPMTGAMLQEITSIDPESLAKVRQKLSGIPITVASDVTNPLTGCNGAACVYGPQKFSDACQEKLRRKYLDPKLKELNDGLENLANRLEEIKEDTDRNYPGAGAAGGLGFGLIEFCGAELERGIEIVLKTIDFAKMLKGANLVVTGEGKLDETSLQGKACMGVVAHARDAGVDTIALVGTTGAGAEHALEMGLKKYHVICTSGMETEYAMKNAYSLLIALASKVVEEYFD